MLQKSSITNFAVIPELRLSFHEGMTALTGETGAGKSIIIDALGLLAVVADQVIIFVKVPINVFWKGCLNGLNKKVLKL